MKKVIKRSTYQILSLQVPPHFHQFLMGTSYFLCTVKKNTRIGLYLCCHLQKTEWRYHLYFSYYNFLKYTNLKFCSQIITLLLHTGKI